MAGRSLVALALVLAAGTPAQKPASDPAGLLGTWRGTSTCTDRVAAPACNDEVVVYEFKPGPKPGIIRWLADKIVDGTRQPMGELEIAWDRQENCWKAEFGAPRATSVWRLSVDGTHLTGTGHLLPGNETIRRVDAKKQ